MPLRVPQSPSSHKGPQCEVKKEVGEERDGIVRKLPTASVTFAKDIELPNILSKEHLLLDALTEKVGHLLFDAKPNTTTINASASFNKTVPLSKGLAQP